MNNLLGLLTSSMTSQSSVNATAKKTGLSASTIMTILSFALPMIMKSLTSNASSASGAASLLSALTQHKTNKSIPDQIAGADTNDGEKIVRHIFGGDTDNAVNEIAKSAGVSATDVTSVLSSIAPSLLSSLGSITASASGNASGVNLADGIDMKDVMGLLGGSSGMTNALGSLLGATSQQSSNKNDGTQLLTSLLSMMK